MKMIKEETRTEFSLSEDNFVQYLKSKLDYKVFEFVNLLNQNLDLLIFSGVIRDFALKYSGEVRDLDLVVRKNYHLLEEIITKFENIKFFKNSFGGYKLNISNISIDIWNVEDTWAFKEDKIQKGNYLEEDLPYSCFFNFSSIVFDFNRNKFIKSKEFITFLEKRILDIVLEENPYPELCVVNSFYYKEKYNLKLSPNLKKYLAKNFNSISQEKFENIQIKHFNKILYPHAVLEKKVNKLGI